MVFQSRLIALAMAAVDQPSAWRRAIAEFLQDASSLGLFLERSSARFCPSSFAKRASGIISLAPEAEFHLDVPDRLS